MGDLYVMVKNLLTLLERKSSKTKEDTDCTHWRIVCRESSLLLSSTQSITGVSPSPFLLCMAKKDEK